ncbi:SNARE syntaxin16 [Acrasis kona]|uniref:SNARE syntaxin16 n=1 Tax=Acrasis kona TaxID=1008807 RepID=A0AAW2Z345_9EUKA
MSNSFGNLVYTDLFRKFSETRSHFVKPIQQPTGNYNEESDDDFIPLRYHDSRKTDDIEQGESSQYGSQVPEWQTTLRVVQNDMDQIRQLVATLHMLHEQHLTPKVKKNGPEEERKIEIQTQDIKRMFASCKKSVESLEIKKEAESQEDVLKKNLKISLVTELTELAKSFRESQQEYLHGMKRLKSKRKELTMFDDGEDDADEAEAQARMQYDSSFSEDQVQQLIANQQDIVRRDAELRDILRSITDLQELFKEFYTLVIEQGSLLDRIDYNVEQTQIHVRQGNENLLVGEKYQKWGAMTLCIIVLVIVLLIVAGVVILRVAGKLTGVF